MARFDVIVDTRVFERRLTDLEKQQLPFARSLAANQAAFETMHTMRRATSLYIDRPTPFTVRSVLYRKGTREAPVAEIYISGDGAKGTPPSKYLTITRGGIRGHRRSEKLLQRRGVLGADEGWVPGKWLDADQYGNQLRPTEVVRILSEIKAFGEEGFRANRRKRKSYAGQKIQGYFLSRGERRAYGPGSGLAPVFPRGIWQRYAYGRAVRPVMLFVKLPRYQKEFDFVALASKEVRRRFLDAWPQAFRRAMRTARRRR